MVRVSYPSTDEKDEQVKICCLKGLSSTCSKLVRMRFSYVSSPGEEMEESKTKPSFLIIPVHTRSNALGCCLVRVQLRERERIFSRAVHIRDLCCPNVSWRDGERQPRAKVVRSEQPKLYDLYACTVIRYQRFLLTKSRPLGWARPGQAGQGRTHLASESKRVMQEH